MAKRDVPDDVIDAVLNRFEEVGLVNDAAFADMLVRTRYSERGLVGQALALELRRRGIDQATAAQAMSQVGPEDEANRARSLAAKKLVATRGLAAEMRLRRAVAQLARKGYSPGLAFEVVKKLLAEEGAEVSEAADASDSTA
jgi:regulatory protein